MNTFARTHPFPRARFPEHLLGEVLRPWPDPQGHGSTLHSPHPSWDYCRKHIQGPPFPPHLLFSKVQKTKLGDSGAAAAALPAAHGKVVHPGSFPVVPVPPPGFLRNPPACFLSGSPSALGLWRYFSVWRVVQAADT